MNIDILLFILNKDRIKSKIENFYLPCHHCPYFKIKYRKINTPECSSKLQNLFDFLQLKKGRSTESTGCLTRINPILKYIEENYEENE